MRPGHLEIGKRFRRFFQLGMSSLVVSLLVLHLVFIFILYSLRRDKNLCSTKTIIRHLKLKFIALELLIYFFTVLR